MVTADEAADIKLQELKDLAETQHQYQEFVTDRNIAATSAANTLAVQQAPTTLAVKNLEAKVEALEDGRVAREDTKETSDLRHELLGSVESLTGLLGHNDILDGADRDEMLTDLRNLQEGLRGGMPLDDMKVAQEVVKIFENRHKQSMKDALLARVRDVVEEVKSHKGLTRDMKEELLGSLGEVKDKIDESQVSTVTSIEKLEHAVVDALDNVGDAIEEKQDTDSTHTSNVSATIYDFANAYEKLSNLVTTSSNEKLKKKFEPILKQFSQENFPSRIGDKDWKPTAGDKAHFERFMKTVGKSKELAELMERDQGVYDAFEPFVRMQFLTSLPTAANKTTDTVKLDSKAKKMSINGIPVYKDGETFILGDRTRKVVSSELVSLQVSTTYSRRAKSTVLS